ncbi:MAG TPA: LysM peptidoglycan-binding domain-containing protein [Dehalococcoidia bacterium]|nr:LysM peptidoglycan-binding domain-containing protein [Dehalococcoidia bacterium]
MKLLLLLILAACCLAVTAACGGGSSGTTALDSSNVATATLPATLPAPQIINGSARTGSQSSYTIKSGDTLAGIAAKFGVSLADLRAANPGIDPARLTVGAAVKLPPQTAGAPVTPAPATAPPASATPAAPAPTARPATATPAPTTPTSLGQTYTVQSGDIPETIAAKFGITVAALLAANPGVDPTKLQVGQVLIIPPRPGG